MPIPEGWKYKVDADGKRQYVGDDPILIDADGKETTLDVAKLLGDLKSANAESAERKGKIRELEAAAEAFKGIDPDKYKQYKRLADKAKALETAEGGEPAELAAKIAELEELLEEVTTERDTLSGKVSSLSERNTRLTVGRAFESDPHFAAKNGSGPLTKMAPEIGLQMFGAYCKPGDDGTVHVYRDLEHKDLIRGEDGKPAPFHDAIGKLGPQFSWWKSQQAERGGSGSGMEDGGGGGLKGRTIKSRADLRSGAEKVEFIKEHGHDAFRNLPASPST